jgi:hypothetical protein
VASVGSATIEAVVHTICVSAGKDLSPTSQCSGKKPDSSRPTDSHIARTPFGSWGPDAAHEIKELDVTMSFRKRTSAESRLDPLLAA